LPAMTSRLSNPPAPTGSTTTICGALCCAKASRDGDGDGETSMKERAVGSCGCECVEGCEKWKTGVCGVASEGDEAIDDGDDLGESRDDSSGVAGRPSCCRMSRSAVESVSGLRWSSAAGVEGSACVERCCCCDWASEALRARRRGAGAGGRVETLRCKAAPLTDDWRAGGVIVAGPKTSAPDAPVPCAAAAGCC